MTALIQRALRELEFRPLLLLAMATLGGVWIGLSWVQQVQPALREEVPPLVPGVALLLLLPAALARWRSWIRVGLVLAAVLAAGGWVTARRLLPPAEDFSSRVIPAGVPNGPFKEKVLKVRGVVADFPARSDFAVQFPLELLPPWQGKVWVRAPYDARVGVGDEISAPLELRALPRAGNPGERQAHWQYVLAGCWVQGRVRESGSISRHDSALHYPALRAIAGMRQYLLEHYQRAFEARPQYAYSAAMAQVMTAMVFGEGGLLEPLPAQVKANYRDAGLAHLLVASGSQVALLAAALLCVARFLNLRRWPLWFLVGPVLVLYALVAGGEASIWRATLAGLGLTAALLLGRRTDGLSLWSLAVLLLVWQDPALSLSLSFQLTFAATFGLIVLSPAITRLAAQRFGEGPVQELAALSLGAQAATLPVSLFHFGSFSAAGLLANFLAVPLASLLVGLGALGLVLDPVNSLNYWLCRWLTDLATGAAALPGARWQTDGVSLGASWMLAALLVMSLLPAFLGTAADRRLLLQQLRSRQSAWQARQAWLAPKPWNMVGWALTMALFSTFLAWWTRPDDLLKVTVLDVGQGEAILVQCAGRNALIDGGSLERQPRSNIGRAVLVPALQAAGVQRLDLLVLTHADADHCNGLAEVVRELPVDAFLDGPSAARKRVDPGATDYLQLRKELEQRRVPFIRPRPGQALEFGAARLRVLAPLSPPLESENDNAVVLKLERGKTSVLLTGDIEAAAERRLLRSGANLDCTVLKVAHHGSRTSTSPEFLRAASPLLALVSCGKYNQFGHPAIPVMERLQEARIPVLRTDVGGSLSVVCNERECSATSFR